MWHTGCMLILPPITCFLSYVTTKELIELYAEIFSLNPYVKAQANVRTLKFLCYVAQVTFISYVPMLLC